MRDCKSHFGALLETAETRRGDPSLVVRLPAPSSASAPPSSHPGGRVPGCHTHPGCKGPPSPRSGCPSVSHGEATTGARWTDGFAIGISCHCFVSFKNTFTFRHEYLVYRYQIGGVDSLRGWINIFQNKLNSDIQQGGSRHPKW